jgi:acetyltransferase-like isoleucine patch superfamily enzyme
MPLPSSLVLRDDSRITVKSHFKIYSGAIVQLARGAYLELGEGFINNEARISCAGEIIIGNGVAIAAQSVLMDKNHHQISGGKPEVGRIIIEDNVWIGIRATILSGVTIGEGAVVAAGAVVTRNIPPRTFCAGVPARVIRDATWT